MSSTDWNESGRDAEQVDTNEVGAAPPGSADEESEGAGDLGSEIGGGESVGSGWTEGGGDLGPEGEDVVGDSMTPQREGGDGGL